MKVFLLITLLTMSNLLIAQNLVSNGGFETFSGLPNGPGEFDKAIGWDNCNGGGSPDYFHMNGTGDVDLPVCFIGTLTPYLGDGIMGFCPYYNIADFREYLTSQLTTALVAGDSYSVSFYVTSGINSGDYCGQGIDKVSVAFTVGGLTQPGSGLIPSVTPQWTTPGILYDTTWKQITFQFTAADAYDHITFGNFVDDASTNVQTFVATSSPGAYYFIDEIEVKPDTASQVGFIASDFSLCEKFCIDFFDQSLNNPTSWQWSFEGAATSFSTDQNPLDICYTIPGTYDVTLITTNANGSDTLTLDNYITVYPTPPFPTITQAGFTLTSSPATSYQWQLNAADIAGASNQSYTVLQTGLYTVVVSDSNGCSNSESKYVLITGIEEVTGDATISIYPNPSSGNFTIEIAGLTANEISIVVVNALGQNVFSSYEKVTLGNCKIEIDASGRNAKFCVSTGIYFVEIITGNVFVRKKILITE